MHLLVDGHNLIPRIPGLNLSDPDDEAQLVMLLRRYATRKRGRQVVVVFDHGVYGHPDRLDGYGVTCYFARSPQDADAQLIRRLGALTRPRDWALVTSDRQVARVAQERGVRVISSQEFAARLTAPTTPPAPTPDAKYDARLSPAEVDEWLRLFGEAPETPQDPPSAPPQDPPRPAERKKGRKRRNGR